MGKHRALKDFWKAGGIDPKKTGVLEVSSDLVDKPVAIRYGWGS